MLTSVECGGGGVALDLTLTIAKENVVTLGPFYTRLLAIPLHFPCPDSQHLRDPGLPLPASLPPSPPAPLPRPRPFPPPSPSLPRPLPWLFPGPPLPPSLSPGPPIFLQFSAPTGPWPPLPPTHLMCTATVRRDELYSGWGFGLLLYLRHSSPSTWDMKYG